MPKASAVDAPIIVLPTIGRIVLYTLTQSDADTVNRRRTTGSSVLRRMEDNPPSWPAGAQAHIGTVVEAGDTLPLIITAVRDSFVNGKVLLDGTDELWVQAVPEGVGGGAWAWPERG